MNTANADSASFFQWITLTLSIASLFIAGLAIFLPMRRDRQREVEQKRVAVEVSGIPQLDIPEEVYGNVPLMQANAPRMSLVVHIANVGGAPLFVRDVRLLFFFKTKDGSMDERPRSLFYFFPIGSGTDVIDSGRSRYYYLPIDENFGRFAWEFLGSASLSHSYAWKLEVRDHRGSLWLGQPNFGSDFSESSIWWSYAHQRKSQTQPQ